MYKINDKAYSWLPIEDIEWNTHAQIKAVSSLPIIYKHLAIMPDCHLGHGAMVGSCIPTKEAIVPSAVGSDAGCGMIAAKTDMSVDEYTYNSILSPRALRENIERDVPLSAGNYNKEYTPSARTAIASLEMLAKDRLGFYNKLSPNWRLQLGTLGSGNHFIEIVKDQKDVVWAFLHSGSRGIGNKLGTHHIKEAKRFDDENNISLPNRDLAYLVEGTEEFDNYIFDLQWAQRFAELNREEMLTRVLKDLSIFRSGEFTPYLRMVQKIIKCTHNYTVKENHFGEDVWITRKGAISAKKNELGLIPGSMGTRSYVTRGLGNADAFDTAPHGAGRNFSRKKAKSMVNMDDFDLYMEGIEVRRSHAFLDELPHAYKDIDVVMENAKTLVEPINTFSQLINVKGN